MFFRLFLVPAGLAFVLSAQDPSLEHFENEDPTAAGGAMLLMSRFLYAYAPGWSAPRFRKRHSKGRQLRPNCPAGRSGA